jgi:hypothetical protein
VHFDLSVKLFEGVGKWVVYCSRPQLSHNDMTGALSKKFTFARKLSRKTHPVLDIAPAHRQRSIRHPASSDPTQLRSSPHHQRRETMQYSDGRRKAFNVKIRHGKAICRGRATGFPWVSTVSSREILQVSNLCGYHTQDGNGRG